MAPNPVKIRSNWNLKMSIYAKDTVNPHRAMAENSKVVSAQMEFLKNSDSP